MRLRPFTLIELLIAIIILAGLTASIFISAAGITSSWERLTAEKQTFSELMVLDRALDSLLSNTIPFRWDNPEDDRLDDRPVFYGWPDQIGFATLGQVHSFETGGLTFVHLIVEDNALIAYYQSRPWINPNVPGEARKFSRLAEGIERIECSYADLSPDGELEWVDQWDPEEERLVIPLAVSLRVFWQNGKEDSWLRRTAGSGQFERYGNWKGASRQ